MTNIIKVMRAFVAMDLEINEKIMKLYDDLKRTDGKFKLVKPENLHLTIKFLGDIDEHMAFKVIKIVKDSVCGVTRYTAKLKGVGVFPNNKNIRVIWIGFHDAGETVKISKIIDERLSEEGFKKEKNYMPHVTIARMKSNVAQDTVLEVVNKYEKIEFGEVKCKTITLKKSMLTPQGPIYTDVEVIPL